MDVHGGDPVGRPVRCSCSAAADEDRPLPRLIFLPPLAWPHTHTHVHAAQSSSRMAQLSDALSATRRSRRRGSSLTETAKST